MIALRHAQGLEPAETADLKLLMGRRYFPNPWNLPGWREVCEAIPCPAPPAGAECL